MKYTHILCYYLLSLLHHTHILTIYVLHRSAVCLSWGLFWPPLQRRHVVIDRSQSYASLMELLPLCVPDISAPRRAGRRVSPSISAVHIPAISLYVDQCMLGLPHFLRSERMKTVLTVSQRLLGEIPSPSWPHHIPGDGVSEWGGAPELTELWERSWNELAHNVKCQMEVSEMDLLWAGMALDNFGIGEFNSKSTWWTIFGSCLFAVSPLDLIIL